MNRQYIYPQNLKSSAKLWFWNLRDVFVLGVSLLLSILALAQIKLFLPLALSLVYAFLSMRIEDTSILDFMKRATRFFLTSQQMFFWKEREH